MATKIGVRELVEFVLRSGDLNQRQGSQNTALNGARIHRRLQKQRGADYEKEVYLKQTVTMSGRDYVIDGRADGISHTDKQYTIEEIKTSDLDFTELSENTLRLYWGQAQVYGYILAVQQELIDVTLQLTYFQTTTETITTKTKVLSRTELTDFFQQLIAEYEEWLVLRDQWRAQRNQTVKQVTFPFPAYRQGQRELAVAVYKTILLQKRLFVEAPTGTGKTISTLFPAIKALGEDKIQRVFYLTAKQSTRQVAEEAVALLSQQGMQLKSITLTAKDKITFAEEADLAPEENPYMLGYYDRIKPALRDLLTNENQLTRAVIEAYARKHMVDPFEFSLDASLFADVIICDYNYLFDPIVYLQRFFSEPDQDNFFLVDEVHNLVSRSRAMYSASVSSQTFQAVLQQTKDSSSTGSSALEKTTRKVKRALTKISKPLRDADVVEMTAQAPLDSVTEALADWVAKVHDWLGEYPDSPLVETLLDAYFTSLTYLKIADLYDDTYQSLVTYDSKLRQTTVKQLCLDPSAFLDRSLSLGAGAILFSATLSPLSYYQQVLGNSAASLPFRLASPFPPQHQALLVTPYIQTTYRQREQNLERIVTSIGAMVNAKTGNYLVFLPSYSYLETVQTAFSAAYPQLTIITQTNQMDETQRAEFLTQFKPAPLETLVAFCVLGGIFSEGIDLKGERLSGVAIVGVGLPGLSTERNLVRDYFDAQQGTGFQYAYQLPGMNHVLQAAGRLIRGSHDVGVILLLDQRFASSRYTQLFPAHWQHFQRCYSVAQLTTQIEYFWQMVAMKDKALD
ncbi:ATP-dependent DNA helicase [Loigolactobacillus jiayinensis]|uniref:DNA 5'-3' helicase n=1 Tax=Loigolactobacillus jiayinensis TaxID=2486016 RepID=A0ABW1RA20_9LACO|nr:ATP-dependent DNA helicase [Loigolactobacillus jiayinensis]